MCGSLLELSRELFDDARDRSHVLHLGDLSLEVFQVELVAGLDLLGELLDGLLVDRLLHVLDEGDDVAHAEDAAGHLFGVKELKAVELFTVTMRTDKAAPPRLSPSSLVRTTPVSVRRSLKARAVLTAS